MRQVSSKMYAIGAMGIGCANLVLFIICAIMEPVDSELSVALGGFLVIGALISGIFLGMDAMTSVLKIFMNIHPAFNAMLALVIFGGFPLCYAIHPALIWTAWPLIVYVLEVISIVKHVKMQREDERMQKRSFAWWRR